MKALIIIAFISISFLNINSQTFEWAYGYGGHIGDGNTHTSIDTEGNVYVIGYTSANVTTGPYYNQYAVRHLIKYTNNGEILWGKFFTGDKLPNLTAMASSDDNSVIISGTSSGDFDFDGVTMEMGEKSNFLLSLDSDGAVKWFQTLDTKVYDITTKNNYIFITGIMSEYSRFNSHNLLLSDKYSSGIYLVKLTSSGVYIWGEVVEGKSFEKPKLAVNDEEEVFLAAYSDYSVLWLNKNKKDLKLDSRNNTFILSFTSSGSFAWKRNLSSDNGHAKPVDIVCDHAGDIYVCGNILGTFPSLSMKAYDYGTYLLKVGKEGGIHWSKVFDTNNTIGHTIVGFEGSSLAIDKNNACVIATCYMRSFDIMDYPGWSNTVTRKGASSDVAIINFHPLGFYQWSKTFGGNSAEWLTDISYDKSDHLIVIGKYDSSSISFDGISITNNSGNGDSDMFIASMTFNTNLVCPDFTPEFIGADTIICQGESVEVKLIYSYGVDYKWLLDGNIINSNDSVFNVTESGSYGLLINNESLCPQRTGSVRIDVAELPEVDLMLSDSTILCPSDTLQLSSVASEEYKYDWFHDGNLLDFGNQHLININESGMYKLHVKNQFCSVSDSVEIIALSIPSIEFQEDTIIFNGYHYLSPLIADGNEVKWFYNFDKEAFSYDKRIATSAPGTYLVVSENFCGIDADDLILKSEYVGIKDEIFNNLSINVSPNPTFGLVNVEITYSLNEAIKISLVDRSGVVLQSENLPFQESYNYQLDLSLYASGIYFIMVEASNRKVIKKIIKQ